MSLIVSRFKTIVSIVSNCFKDEMDMKSVNFVVMHRGTIVSYNSPLLMKISYTF